MIKRIDAGKPEKKSDARKSKMTEAPILEPRYDSRQSFYGKAYYTEPARDGSITLYSYETPVVRICADGEVELLPAWDYSQTTLRHVKEFLKQQGYSAGSKAEIARMYTEVNESVEKTNSSETRTVSEAKRSGKFDSLHYYIADQDWSKWSESDYRDVMYAIREADRYQKTVDSGRGTAYTKQRADELWGEVERLIDKANKNADAESARYKKIANTKDMAKVESASKPRRRRIAEGNEYGYVSLKNISVPKLAKAVNSAIAELVDEIDSGNAYSTYHWTIGKCDEGAVVVALGFAGGYEPNENEFTDKYGDAIAIKFGILADNSAMAEYDMDIIMPYGDDGDVWDSETSITSFDATSDVEWVVDEAKAWADSVNSGR